LGASLVADNPAPFFASAAVLAVLLYEYEKAMREPITNRRDLRTGQPLAADAAGSRRGR
jgi:hypothetical protein